MLRALKEESVKLYCEALARFKAHLAEAGFDWKGASDRGRDACLADYLVELWEQEAPRSHASLVLAAVRKVSPDVRMSASSAVMTTWVTITPPKQATAAPEEVALAMGCLATAIA